MRKPLSLLAGAAILAATAGCLVSMPKTNPLPSWDSSLLVTTARLAGAAERPAHRHHPRGPRPRQLRRRPHPRRALSPPLLPRYRARRRAQRASRAARQLERAFEERGRERQLAGGAVRRPDGLLAARAFFTLDYLGKMDAALLDGGLEQWRKEARPYTEAPSCGTGALTVRAQPGIVVDADWVRVAAGERQHHAAGGRPPARRVHRRDPGRRRHAPRPHPRRAQHLLAHLAGERAGHRACARPRCCTRRIPWPTRRFGDTVVAYCRTGVQASHAYYVARYLRRPVVMYDGSFIDWSRRGEEYPVERGTGEEGGS